MKRVDVDLVAGDGQCAAWLYTPELAYRPPVIILAHGLGGTRDMRLDAYAERFADAGYACLVFDYRHFGDSPGYPRRLIDIRRQLADWSAALAWTRADPRVDANRVVLWGSSFSGGHVLRTAAVDGGVAAVIAQCPFTDGIASALAMDPATALRVTARAVADVVSSWFARNPVRVAVAGRPHSAALMTAADALPGVLALTPEPESYQNDVPARIALHIPLYRPGRDTSKVLCPIFFGVCDTDTVAPSAATLRHARRATNAEIKHYSAGHFAIYLGAEFEQAVADQLAFLAAHVPVSAEPR